MFKQQKLIYLSVILVLLAGMACSTIQRFDNPEGESQDASHDQWIDESGAEAGIDVMPDAEADHMDEGSESTDSSGALDNINIDASLDDTTLSHLIKSGDMIIEMIESTGGGTQGQIVEVIITNQSGEEIVFEVPPGLVFSPVETDEQDLMVLDGEVVTLEPGETIVFSPYVICIEADAAAPSSGSAYQIGYLESGDLLAFAECVDEEAEGTLAQDDIGLQFAVWSIASGGNVMEMPDLTELEEGALSGLTEEWEAIPGMMETMEEMILVISEDWLQRCEISVGGEE